jgi:hypothetical protein
MQERNAGHARKVFYGDGLSRLLPKQQAQTPSGSLHYPRLPGCNHKYRHEGLPAHRNCNFCWGAFFQNHGEIVELADEMYRGGGPQELMWLQGKKFVKYFQKFMATVSEIREGVVAA